MCTYIYIHIYADTVYVCVCACMWIASKTHHSEYMIAVQSTADNMDRAAPSALGIPHGDTSKNHPFGRNWDLRSLN